MTSLPAATNTEPVAATSASARTTDTPPDTAPETQTAPAQEMPPPSQQQQQQQQQQPQQEESIEPSAPTDAATAKPAPPVDLSRSETEAIGPSTDTPAANPDSSNGPVVVIMLLLTTGARHPYKIDERYLKKRNVTVENMDPYNISVYTLKELIWRDWREGECILRM